MATIFWTCKIFFVIVHCPFNILQYVREATKNALIKSANNLLSCTFIWTWAKKLYWIIKLFIDFGQDVKKKLINPQLVPLSRRKAFRHRYWVIVSMITATIVDNLKSASFQQVVVAHLSYRNSMVLDIIKLYPNWIGLQF